jgi:hypothetical protein
LRTVRDGKRVLTTAPSHYQHMMARLIASHPADGPEPKGKVTSTVFKKSRRGEAQAEPAA